MPFFLRLLVFLVINYGLLAIGGLFTDVQGPWYQSLDRAPWTPPGWVFGAAWFTIMACYSVYLAKRWPTSSTTWKKWVFVSWLANVSWNPVFFHFQWPEIGILVLSLLALAIGALFWLDRKFHSNSRVARSLCPLVAYCLVT